MVRSRRGPTLTPMATIVIVTSELAGRISISCEIARRLEAGGHTVHIAGRHPAVASAVAARRIPYLDVTAPHETGDARPTRAGPLGRLADLIRRLASGERRARTLRRARELGTDRFKKAVARLSPDLVLVDLELTELLMASMGSSQVTAGWTSMQSVWKGRGLPPLGSSIVPGRGPAGSLAAIELAWLRLRMKRWLRYLRQRITRVGEDRITVLRWAARSLDCRFDEEFDLYQWLVPAVPRRVPVLSFTLAELEFPHEPAPQLIHAGPVIGERPTRDDAVARVRAVAHRVQGRPGKALVYCSFGAWDKGNDRDLVARVVAAVASRPDWELVVGLGDRLDPSTLGVMPDNVHLFRWAPQIELLELANVAIHHAGISSVNECLRFGVPMVVYPFDFLDQPGNAARVVFHGLGIRGDRTADDPATIVGHLERAIEGEFRQAVRAMQQTIERYEADQVAVSAVTRLLPAQPEPDPA